MQKAVILSPPQSIESSVTHFEKIMTNFTSVKFPAAYYAAGRAYTCLRQHSDAVAMAKLGLEMVTVSSACPPLTYPGTETVMEDSKRGIVEVRVLTISQTCTQPSCSPCLPLSSPSSLSPSSLPLFFFFPPSNLPLSPPSVPPSLLSPLPFSRRRRS